MLKLLAQLVLLILKSLVKLFMHTDILDLCEVVVGLKYQIHVCLTLHHLNSNTA